MPSARVLPPTTHVLVEVIRLGLADGGRVGWSLSTATTAGEDPDRVARHLVGEDGPAVLVLHSTSWRWEPPGVVVLTYAAVVEDVGPDVDVLVDPVIVTSGDPLRPRPDGLHDHHVVAHAVWHLAVLAQRDPVVGAVAADPAHGPLFAALALAAGVMPTATFAQAHPAAPGQRAALGRGEAS